MDLGKGKNNFIDLFNNNSDGFYFRDLEKIKIALNNCEWKNLSGL